ncbi:hypothetical protein [Comamonas odontotermitis]|uniref:hypothetical protein n=1 Tax=Comamonas odontotermitis TaxID=379895 RepID=UPI001CC513F6|nr:hypothetical protein [Comamonas odontotermitis]UBB15441.1 hypothetical protein LAD35_11200 [Comamonas odontotermitis]
MKRSGFKRQERQIAPKPVCRPLPAAPNYAQASTAATPVSKGAFLRHEGYRRLVASLPCIACKIVGYSQAAHANHGKGTGLKTDDRTCFPLCCDRPGVKGCHPKFDQYELYPRLAAAIVAEAWGADTRRKIEMQGKWPRDLPKWLITETEIQQEKEAL